MWRVRPRAVQLCLLAAIAAVSACGSPRVDISRGARTLQPYDYHEVFGRWSREVQVLPVDGIENVLTARATYLSHEFRWAYVVRVAHDLRLSLTERQALHDREFEALDAAHEFYVTVMSGVDGSDDLSPETGTWQIRLEDDGGRVVEPLEVVEVRKPTVSDTKYFAFDKVDRTAYRITFPLLAADGKPLFSGSTGFFRLTFSSPLGQTDMRWETTVADREGEGR